MGKGFNTIIEGSNGKDPYIHTMCNFCSFQVHKNMHGNRKKTCSLIQKFIVGVYWREGGGWGGGGGGGLCYNLFRCGDMMPIVSTGWQSSNLVFLN